MKQFTQRESTWQQRMTWSWLLAPIRHGKQDHDDREAIARDRVFRAIGSVWSGYTPDEQCAWMRAWDNLTLAQQESLAQHYERTT